MLLSKDMVLMVPLLIIFFVPEVIKPEKTVMIQNNFTNGFDPEI